MDLYEKSYQRCHNQKNTFKFFSFFGTITEVEITTYNLYEMSRDNGDNTLISNLTGDSNNVTQPNIQLFHD